MTVDEMIEALKKAVGSGHDSKVLQVFKEEMGRDGMLEGLARIDTVRLWVTNDGSGNRIIVIE